MNRKIEKILVTIDFSEPSLNALDTAAAIAKNNKAALLILHVQDDIFKFMKVSALTTTSVTNNSFSILTALAGDIQAKTGIVPRVIEESGHTTEVILKTALNNRCDLIVMGTYGASGYRSGYIGTTAYSVVKFTPCPVLLIPGSRKWNAFKKPLFPIRSGITLLRHFYIIRQFTDHQGTLDILALADTGRNAKTENLDEIVADLQDRLSADTITTSLTRTNTGPVFQNTLSQAEISKSDLIIITPTIDVTTKQFYIGPNTHAIVNNSKVPVLIINKVNIYTYVNPAQPA